MTADEQRAGVGLTNLDQPLGPVARVAAMHEGKRRAKARRGT